MLLGIIRSLGLAWFLSLFGAADIFVNFIQQYFPHATISTDYYYLLAAIIGAVVGIIKDWDSELIE